MLVIMALLSRVSCGGEEREREEEDGGELKPTTEMEKKEHDMCQRSR
jgi:hypothetical protein